MTREDKLKAINQRIGRVVFDEPAMISFLLLANHVGLLVEQEYLHAPYRVTEMGKNMVAICNEFDWEITDADIVSFCEENFHPNQILPFFTLLRTMVNRTA